MLIYNQFSCQMATDLFNRQAYVYKEFIDLASNASWFA